MDTFPNTFLRDIIRPGRYTNSEWNSHSADWDAASLRLVLAYPDLYEVGISSTGLQSLYSQLNATEETLAERVYAPARDMAHALRAAERPLFALESQRPLTAFDAILVELPNALCFPAVLLMLDLAGIPIRQSDRDAGHPLVIAWGKGVANPEPLADFLDMALLGDAEGIVPGLMAAMPVQESETRAERLRRIAQTPGVYVPSLYAPQKTDDGGLAPVAPVDESVPSQVDAVFLPALPPAPARPLVPYVEALRDEGVLELQRGCLPGCPTCAVGQAFPPIRRRNPVETEAALVSLIQSTGYEEVRLLADCLHSDEALEELVRSLALRCRDTQTALHLDSVHAEAVTPALAHALSLCPTATLSLAPMLTDRDYLHHLLTDEDGTRLCDALDMVGDTLGTLRLTLVTGHPTERPEDARAVSDFVRGLRRVVGRKTRVRVHVSPFVARPHTVFQWAEQTSLADVASRLQSLRRDVSRAGASASTGNAEVAYIEGLLVRGDRELSNVVLQAWRLGAHPIEGRDGFDMAVWQQAFEKVGVAEQAYTRSRETHELPWTHLTFGADNVALQERFLALTGV